MKIKLPLSVTKHTQGTYTEYLITDANHRLIAWSANQECGQALVALANMPADLDDAELRAN